MSDRAQKNRRRLLAEGIAAFNRGDQASVLAVFAPDVESHVGRGLLNAGTWTGHDGYIEMVTAWGEAWEQIEIEPVGFEEPDPDHVVAELIQRAVGAGSGVPVEMTLFWLFQFRDGLVVRFHLYPDRDAALAAL
jgi:ketosteroid isomerase-like protein